MLTLLVLASMWLLLSGHYTLEEPLIATFGALSCVVVWLLSRRMQAAQIYRTENTLGPKTFLYLPWLLGQIVKANLQVARIIVDPKLPISPRLIHVKTSQRGETGQVLYANSITLTPGTISVDVREDTISVHALTTDMAEGVESGEMDRRVSRVEKAP